jgi:hypothetical protein
VKTLQIDVQRVIGQFTSVSIEVEDDFDETNRDEVADLFFDDGIDLVDEWQDGEDHGNYGLQGNRSQPVA